MTPAEAAAAVKEPILRLGEGFMISADTRAKGRELGLRSRPLYHLGRGGALGDVPAEVVIAAFAFFPPEVVTTAWEQGRAVMPPPAAARAYAALCNAWGREHLTGQPGIERTAELLERVVAYAEPAGLPLFAGWRALPLPDDVPGRLAQLLMVMREHRGAVHVAAVAAVGLGPLEAIVAGTYGAANATFFEWPEPYPDPAPHRARWDAAEDLTMAGAAPPYDALSPDERLELAGLLTSLHKAVLGG